MLGLLIRVLDSAKLVREFDNILKLLTLRPVLKDFQNLFLFATRGLSERINKRQCKFFFFDVESGGFACDAFPSDVIQKIVSNLKYHPKIFTKHFHPRE